MATKKKADFVIRQATLNDVDKMVALEDSVWGDNGAGAEKLESRIHIFPAGNIVAESAGHIVGYIAFEYVDDVANMPHFTWSQITDDGTIARSHKPHGEYVYGINLSVHHSMNGCGLGTILPLQVWIDMIRSNKRGSFLGSRIPGFNRYRKSNPDISVENYVNLQRHGKPRDAELRLYAQEGLLPVKVLPDYFPDEESQNYGVLVYRRNPFYNWPFSSLWAWAIQTIVPQFIRESIATKKE